MNTNRIRRLNNLEYESGSIIYWMSRDQRAADNWALIYAQEYALQRNAPLRVVFCLVPEFLGATMRHYAFMLEGLREIEGTLRKYGIPFDLVTGDPPEALPVYIRKTKAGALITDFSPLHLQREWKNRVRSRLTIPFNEVDAHNIVPVWVASDKQEFGAYTIRPKIHRHLATYLEEFPKIRKHPHNEAAPEQVDWDRITKSLKVDTAVGPVDWLRPGEKGAAKKLDAFLDDRLTRYATDRNDPNQDAVSGLSPYLHFGQIAAQRVALAVRSSRKKKESRDAFLEELIVRRELSDNFCFYNERYDSFDGIPAWAQRTLNEHRRDAREYLYSLEAFERGETHDQLWNAAQHEMVTTGKMHGYLRMYWAKKILEWTESPDEALAIGIYLNDRYELDGRDPNGYTGLAWSIGGVHDRAWSERPVFGKIRYMNYNGSKRKFDVDEYIRRQKL
jgi:deoxyribodipyrimidine photo-lyase